MREHNLVRIAAFAILCALGALFAAAPSTNAQDEQLPDWVHATPWPAAMLPSPEADDGQPHHVAGSTAAYTKKQIDSLFFVKDWFPNEHPPIPPVVAGGPDAKVFACATCHLPNGMGHPESASLAGLPAKYIVAQIAAISDGSRRPIGSMPRVAKALTPDQVQQAATYFSSLKPVQWIKVVESATAPATYPLGSARLPLPGASPQPLGHRIIELPQSVEGFLNHDPHSGFVAYVPVGSIAAGRALVAGGSGVTACATCHGAGLHGNPQLFNGVPWLAGRSPTYVYRQLWDFQHGARTTPADAPMEGITKHLTDDQKIAIAAYVASLKP